MGIVVWLVLLVLPQLQYATPIDTETDLPPYLRGIGWRNVEMELRKDMRLILSLRPISYYIDLTISVRGYNGAERSTFNGSVTIALNASTPIDKIELHSVGLNINKAEFMSEFTSSPVEIKEIINNRERETVILTLPETLQPTVSAVLQIHYNGTSVMRGIGLYESWTDHEDQGKYPLPTVSLITNCEPTGARRWFPSFDEPDKKATFRLSVVHPTKLAAYSNTAGETKVLEDGLSMSSFHPTVPLPTYVFAFALTEQPVKEVEHKGQKIRAIGRNRMTIVAQLQSSIDEVRGNPAFKNVTFIPEKTDWLIVEDFTAGAMENPGLITSKPDPDSYGHSTQVHELIHMYFGNLVTLRSWEQIWINEGFADFFEPFHFKLPSEAGLLFSSHHDPALHAEFTYSRSQFITNHFMSKAHIHYIKAGQLISLIKRFIGEFQFNSALNASSAMTYSRYLIDNSFGNGDSKMMIDYLSEDNDLAKLILNDWVYQPGVALLSVSVEEQEGRAIIEQRRFMKTDFLAEIRDTSTRWSIPIYYTVNGKEHMQLYSRYDDKLIIYFPANSTFSIDEYPLLYAVHYTKRVQIKNNAYVIHNVTFKNTNDEISRLVGQTTIIEELQTPSDIDSSPKINPKYVEWNDLMKFCTLYASNKSVDDLMESYLTQKHFDYLLCDTTLSNKEHAKTFLFNLLVSNDLPVRNSDLGGLAKGINNIHPGILLEFITDEQDNIDYLDEAVWVALKQDLPQEENGIGKLREIVRSNPSFAANFYYMFTSIFEQNFIAREMERRRKLFEQRFKKYNENAITTR